MTQISPTGLSRNPVWQLNKTTLWYYPTHSRKFTTPLLLIYSPVNKPDILDLIRGKSVIGSFVNAGFEVYLLEFGEPGYEDKDDSLEDYVAKYVQKAASRTLLHSKAENLTVIGYCLGGTLAAIYASIAEEKIKNLILYAAPIDFEETNVYSKWLYELRSANETDINQMTEWSRLISASEVKAGMRLLTSPVYFSPYLALLGRTDDPAYIQKWIRFNKWANSYLPMPGAFVRDIVLELAKKNSLIKGKLSIMNRKVKLKNISCNLLVICGEDDQLVSENQSRPIIEHVSSKDKTFLISKKGHTGVTISEGQLPEFLDKWLPPRSR
ncbi:alpha/beta fold hydrolase [Metabacillus indicus]|uniref:alpha/beta fold hydrolase n=1 Tax=Metabacillus indicus TaxID=246786 RepID=UPI002A07233C|nr:alpha/beta fold hydrolase [Metabacillus indicus]MDX8288448.1 alpha/beta fold hydrolase [Metabacillus indicus]